MDTTQTQSTREQLREAGFDLMDQNLAELIDCLGEALQKTGEEALLPYLPWRGNLPVGESPPEGVQQLYSIGFQLLNMVEERAASATRRNLERRLGASANRGLWDHAMGELKAMGLSPEQILEVLRKVHVEPVLTAHPTEAKRTSVRERQRDLYAEMVKNEMSHYTPREHAQIHERMVGILQALWRTSEIHLIRPDIYSELRNAIQYLRDLFPASVAQLDEHFSTAWKAAGFPIEMLREQGNIPRLSFGSWIGGDRDGHPLVTPEVTENTLVALRQGAFDLLHRELNDMASKLTFSPPAKEIPEALQHRIDALAEELEDYPQVLEIRERACEEPWRRFGKLMALRVFAMREGRVGYRSPEELREDLLLITKTLSHANCDLSVEQCVYPLLHKLDMFGFHLAALDVRQNSEFHDKAISQLLTAAGVENGENYATWSEDERIAFISHELKSSRPFLHTSVSAGVEADDVLACYRVLSSHRKQWGDAALGALIVSMTRSLSDLLGVYLLAREAGLTEMTEHGLVCIMEVVPLFETMDDLDRSPGILSAFLSHPFVQRSRSFMANRDPLFSTQQVMLGYSDSNKDCGILAAQWALHLAEQRLTETGRKFGVPLCFFHGRGGTISRGAGPTHWFMAALPDGAMSGHFRMTEQGETIAQNYGNRTNATFNLELLLAGATITTAKHLHGTPTVDRCEAFMPQIAQESQQAYQRLLREDGFIEFYRQATPIDALENSRIGSRPARRTGKKGFSISDLRAIPWVFSWTQARYYLPGWYGVGSALQILKEQNPQGFAELQRALPNSAFLTYVLTNVETNLESANLELMEKYGQLVEDVAIREKFVKQISHEFLRTKSLLAELFNGEMSTRRPRMARTLKIREEPLHVLHMHQIELLRKWREAVQTNNVKKAEEMLPQLLLSINAIASGLRTTG